MPFFQKHLIIFLWILMLFVAFQSLAQEDTTKRVSHDFSVELKLDNRFFLSEGLYEGQERNYLSGAIQPEYSLESEDGKHNFKVTLFGRLDQFDENRTHFDIRELYYQHVAGNWEISLGLKKVFWGVTESLHLIDIINQTDQVESFDGEQKLGQPMLHLSYLSNFGTFDFFYLPYARKRQFPARKGRLRFPTVIERDDFRIDSGSEEWHPSFAFRWSHYVGIFDVSLSHFYGVGREPLFLNLTTEPDFFYPIIHQTGISVQATTGSALWKLESIYRYAEQQDFIALVGGVEYTFGNIASSGIDLGLIAEYLYDERGDLAISNFDNDIFAGFRLAFNDTQSTDFLAGVIFDLEKSTKFYSLEASRRLGKSWKAEIEARIFDEVSPKEFAYFFRNDSFLQFRLSKFF